MRVKPFTDQGHYTEVHNLAFDYIMPRVSGSAWKVLCFIIRQTRGWGKKSEFLPYEAIKTGTGIKTDATVSKALQELMHEANWGSPIILKQDAETRGVSQREPTRYALNRAFEIRTQGELVLQKMKDENSETRSSKNEGRNEVRPSKNEASRSSKNEGRKTAPYKDTRGFTEERSEESYYVNEEEEERVREDISSSSSPSSSSSSSSNSDVSNLLSPLPLLSNPPVFAALCDVCKFSPDSVTPKNLERMPLLIKWLRETEGGFSDDEIAAKIRAYFAHWDLEKPPHLAQIRSEWRRMKSLHEKRTVLQAQQENQPDKNQNGSYPKPDYTNGIRESAAERRSREKGDIYEDLQRRERELNERKQRLGIT